MWLREFVPLLFPREFTFKDCITIEARPTQLILETVPSDLLGRNCMHYQKGGSGNVDKLHLPAEICLGSASGAHAHRAMA